MGRRTDKVVFGLCVIAVFLLVLSLFTVRVYQLAGGANEDFWPIIMPIYMLSIAFIILFLGLLKPNTDHHRRTK